MSQVFVEGLLQTRIIEAQERLTEINQVRRTTFDQFAEAFVDYEKCKGVQDFVVNGSMGSQRFKMERSEKHGFIELYGQIASNFAKVVFRPLARIYYGEEKRLSIRVSQELRVEFKMARKNPIVTCVAWERELEINATPYDLLMGALIASGNFDD
jgi:hypothetical protein